MRYYKDEGNKKVTMVREIPEGYEEYMAISGLEEIDATQYGMCVSLEYKIVKVEFTVFTVGDREIPCVAIRYWYCTHPGATEPWLVMDRALVNCYLEAIISGYKYTVREITKEEHMIYRMGGMEVVGYVVERAKTEEIIRNIKHNRTPA